MKFTRLVSLIATVVSAGVLVAAAPVDSLSPRTGSGGCNGCDYGSQALSLVTSLQVEVHKTLTLLDDCYTNRCNPTHLFVELTASVEQCNSAMVAVGAGGSSYSKEIQVQVSEITAEIVVAVGTGFSKFRDVRIENFDYVTLCAKIDVALKGLCITLDVMIKGILKLVSSICLPKAAILLAANLKACLYAFGGISPFL